MNTSAGIICTGALALVGAIDPEDLVASGMSGMLSDAFRRLNLMMGVWSLQPFTIPVEAREVFPTIAGKGSPSNPYTVGPGGDCNMPRPAALTRAGLLLNASQPIPVEIPRGILTRAGYAAQSVKDLQAPLYTDVFYNPTFAGGLGALYTFPVVNNNLNSIVLYHPQQLGPFTSLTASYDLPDGADEAVEYNLARRLLTIYSVPIQTKQDILALAASSLAIYKRAYTPMSDQPVETMWTPWRRRGGYNIVSGEGA